VRRFPLRPDVALAIYAHPDDADVAAGGARATWSSAGSSVHLLIVCDGAKGSHEPRGDVVDRRTDELAAAASELGCASVYTLGREDGGFDNDVALREDLVREIRRLKPTVVLGPDPTATFFGAVYVNHRDHRETGWALLDAVAPASAMPLYFPDAGPPHAVAHLLLSGTHQPNVVVDVTSAVETKVRAVLAHTSQVAGDADGVREMVLTRASQAGKEIGVHYGESFRHITLER
jgi:LmbE family N-acetylglucosaminyl deacetylase